MSPDPTERRDDPLAGVPAEPGVAKPDPILTIDGVRGPSAASPPSMSTTSRSRRGSSPA
jgi:hypothetical protein